MKKALIAIILAILTLAACTKDDDPAAFLDGTRWSYSYTENTGRKITCDLSLRKNGGGLVITDRYSSSQTGWSDRWEYHVKTYTYDGTHGTISLQQGSSYTENGIATFTLNTPKTKMHLNCPIGSYTLELK